MQFLTSPLILKFYLQGQYPDTRYQGQHLISTTVASTWVKPGHLQPGWRQRPPPCSSRPCLENPVQAVVRDWLKMETEPVLSLPGSVWGACQGLEE